MSWVRLDDKFPNHPKVVRVGGDAAWLYVAGLCYANEHLTNGFVPAAAVPRLTDRRNPQQLAARLVEAVLWEPVDGGYRVHDYREYQEGADEVRAKRDAGRKRIAAWRAKQTGNGVPARYETSTERGCNAVTEGEVTSTTPAPAPAPASVRRSPEPPLSPASGGTLTGQQPSPRKERQATARAEHKATAIRVLDELNDGRRRLRIGEPLRPTDGNLDEIIKRLRDGATLAECVHVVSVGEAEVAAGGEPRWFNPATLFRAKTFPQRLALPSPIPPPATASPAAIAAQEERDAVNAQRKLALFTEGTS